LSIHPTAIVSERARVAADVEIGPFCVIEGEVEIGAGTVVESHVRIGSRYGRVVIGERNHIQYCAVLGGPAQDLTYESGAYTALSIGSHNRVGEFVTIHLGTAKGGGLTRIGDHCFIMAHAHIAHDCQIADHVIMVNSAQIGGHVIVEHHATVGGCAIVTQLNRVGEYSFLAIGATANKDLLPYTIVEGHWAAPRATNRVGLKRAGFDEGERRNIDRAVRILLQRSLTIEEATARIEAECAASPQIAHLLEFVRTSERGIARG
jgi:UDP-N-acetylglucosamine acyltransferase